MDYSLPTLFVVPTAATLSTAGGSETLTTGQLGIYINDLKTPATAINIVDTFFQIAQGRTPEDKVTLGSKKSGKFNKTTKMEWYKVSPNTGVNTTKIELTDFGNMKCDEHYSLSMRFSSLITNALYYGGRLDSVYVTTPCCDCGADPCANLTDAQILAILTDITAQANAKWSSYATFTLTGTTVADFKITIETLPITTLDVGCLLYPEQTFDTMLVIPYFTRGAMNSNEPLDNRGRCDDGITSTVVQRATFPIGKADSVRAMEAKYYTYQHWMKNRISIDNAEWRQHFTSFVDGDDYTMYVLKGRNTSSNETWASYVHTDQIVMVAFPSGHAAAASFETILEANLGAAIEYAL